MSPLLFTLQTDFDTVWLNCTEEYIEQVHIIFRDAHNESSFFLYSSNSHKLLDFMTMLHTCTVTLTAKRSYQLLAGQSVVLCLPAPGPSFSKLLRKISHLTIIFDDM